MRRVLLSSLAGAFLIAGVPGVADAGPSDLPRVIARVAVGEGPAGVAVNDQLGLAYVANYRDNTISVIDQSSNTAKPIKVPGGPADVGVNNVTNRVYVAGYDGGTVSVIDPKLNEIVATIPLAPGLSGVAVNSSTDEVYVTNQSDGTVTVIDGADNGIVTTLPVGGFPSDVALNPATNRVYVARHDAVTVVYPDNNYEFKNIPVGVNLNGITVSAELNRIYVTDVFPGKVHAIDGVMNAVVGTATAGNYPLGVSVSPASGRVYVANQGHNELGRNDVTAVDAASLQVLGSIDVGTEVWPSAIAVDPVSRHAFVSLGGNATVAVLGPEA